jgi:hypothetical protein
MTDRLKVNFVRFGSEDGRTWSVEATTERGQRWHLCQRLDDEGVAARLVKKIEAVGSINTDHWNRGFNVFGSDAFVAEEREAHAWAQSVRAGHCSEEQVPDSLRTLL